MDNTIKKMISNNVCYEQHIVAIKNIYEEYLFAKIVPAIYEGILSMYKKAIELERKYAEHEKLNSIVKNPGVLILFQRILKEIPNMNQHRVKCELERIRTASGIANIFDDLIYAVIKSNIIILTFNIDKKRHELIDTKYHENILIPEFILTCYIEASKFFFDHPELFWHKYDNQIINNNKRICIKHITNSIKIAINQLLPMKEILLEYLLYPPYNNKNERFNDINIDRIIDDDLSKIGVDPNDGILEESLSDHIDENDTNNHNVDSPIVPEPNSNVNNQIETNKQPNVKLVDIGPLLQSKKFRNIIPSVKPNLSQPILAQNTKLNSPQPQSAKIIDKIQQLDSSHADDHEVHTKEHDNGIQLIDNNVNNAAEKIINDILDI